MTLKSQQMAAWQLSGDHFGSPFVALIILSLLPFALHAQVQTGYPASKGQMYMESMYLPPVSTGPWAPAWSPDGKRLAFCMNGSIWIIAAEGGVASQLTNGPDYDCQPAWSPDGKIIAFTRDTGHSIDIWSIDLDGNNLKSLTQDNGLSVNPAWISDNDVLFTSGRGEHGLGLWETHVGGGGPEPVAVDQVAQNLQASVAPDTHQIVFVSNRRVFAIPAKPVSFGSGDLWVMDLATKQSHLLVEDESLWRADPRWSPDGHKIVYVSARTGRNQLWLANVFTGIPAQLTYIDAEPFCPSWSPDGNKIAYISNSGSAFHLWVMPAVGGAATEIKIEAMRYRVPTGHLNITVKDDRGLPTAARIYLTAADGKSYAPRGAFARVSSITGDHYFSSTGTFSIDLPVGSITVEAMKGFEFHPEKKQLTLAAGETVDATLNLTRLLDLAAEGWYSGDTHLHMNYGGILGANPNTLLLEADAEDLNVVNDLPTNWNNRLIDLSYFTGAVDSHSLAGRILYFNEEYRPMFAGHLGLLNLKEYLYPVYDGYVGTPYSADYPSNAEVLDKIHAQGAIGGYVHPYFTKKGQDPLLFMDYYGAREFPADVALGKVDYYDLMSIWTNDYVAAEVWYKLLNLGFRIPVAAGTDAMTDYWRAPTIGSVRVYVKTPAPLQYQGWIDGLKAGRTFVTNGPLISFRVNNEEPGGVVHLPKRSSSKVHIEAEAVSILPMDALEIIENGKVIATINAEGSAHAKYSSDVTINSSGWLAARVTGAGKQHLLLDDSVYAHTSPIYIQKGQARPQSREDALYFVKWMNRVLELIDERKVFDTDTPAQTETVKKVYKRAREIFNQMAKR